MLPVKLYEMDIKIIITIIKFVHKVPYIKYITYELRNKNRRAQTSDYYGPGQYWDA